MKTKLLFLSLALMTMGEVSEVKADTTIADLTATNTESTYIHGALADYSYWTLTAGATGSAGLATSTTTYIAWFYTKNTTNTLSTTSGEELPVGTYLLSSNLVNWKSSTNTLAITSEDGSAEIATKNINVVGKNYTAFYVSTAQKVKFTFTVTYGKSSGETQIGEQVLYTVAQGTTVGDYTALFAGATTAEIESMLAGMSEAKKALSDLLATANDNYTSMESLVGDGVFQLSATLRNALKTAIDDAQAVFDNASSTDSDYETQTEALTAANNAFMTTYNAPDAEKYYYLTISDGAFYINMNGYDAWDNGNLMPVLSTVPYALQFEAKNAAANEYYVKNAEGKYYVKGASNYATNVSDEASTYFIVHLQADGTIQLQSSWQSSYYLALTAANRKAGSGVGVTNKDFLNITVTEATTTNASMFISSSADWGTFVAPFAVELPTGVTAYTCTYTEGTLTTTATGSQTVAANTPVLLHKAGGLSATNVSGYAQSYWSGLPESYSLVGTLSAITLPTDGTVYLLQKQDDVVGWYQYSSGTISSTANRAYLKVPAAAARQFIPLFDDSETTGITQVNGEDVKANDYYNLKGQRVSQPTKGLYIVGGRKVMVK